MKSISLMMDFIMGALFAAGLLLAGSDGAWFPWLNFAGVFLFFLFVYLANRLRPVPWR